MKPPRDYIIFALDVPDFSAARPLIDALAGRVGLFKVGLELFIRGGQQVIDYIRDHGRAGIFLDLKLHDIPTTVERAMRSMRAMQIDLATVHCAGSIQMLSAAVTGAGGKVGVLGVTVLTSLSAADLADTGHVARFVTNLPDLVLTHAAAAQHAGCVGVVCSGQEAAMLKQRLGPRFLAVTPGIRPNWQHSDRHDQQRVTTPHAAVANGADYLVIGRPIRDATDPALAAERVEREIAAALASGPSISTNQP